MDQVVAGVRLLQGAVFSNFWGLGCPIYCTQPSLALLLLVFLLGALSGLGASVFLFLRLGLFRPPEVAEDFVSPARARLQGYAHAKQ